MRGFGGDGADDGAVDAGAVHGGEEAGGAAVGGGLDVALLLEEGNGLGGEGVFEDVGVEVDEHEKREFRIQDSESRMEMVRKSIPDFMRTPEC